MSIVKSEKLSYEYIRRDEDGNVEGITKALDELDIDIEQGSFIAVLGANGSGKSTFAKTLNRLLVPSSGTLWVDGFDTSDDENIWEVRQSAGMVFQNPDNQIISSVVEEDVGFGPENLGVPTEQIWSRVSDALTAVEMEKYAKKSPNRLSGGQKQRVAIAGILAMNPKCIILDESTAMLDPKGRKEVLDTVYALNKTEKVTIILITHFMEEVLYADTVFVIDKGKIKMSGTPGEVFSNEELLEECKLELPCIAKLARELYDEGLNIPQGILSIEELVEAICRLY